MHLYKKRKIVLRAESQAKVKYSFYEMLCNFKNERYSQGYLTFTTG